MAIRRELGETKRHSKMTALIAVCQSQIFDILIKNMIDKHLL